jgi:hypothetical protein
MKVAKIEIGRQFYSSFKEQKFTPTKIDGDSVTVEYEDGTIMNWMDGKKGLHKFLKHSIEKKLEGWEINADTNISWTLDMIESKTNGFNEIFDHMKDNIDIVVDDEWTDSRNKWIKNLPNQSKGKFALNAYCCSMEASGRVVEKNEKGDYNTGSERVAKIDSEGHIVRSAFKTSSDKSLTLNHIRKNEDWDKLICMIIMPNEMEVYEADRDLVYIYLEENPNEIVWITKDDMNVIHWHMEYPLPEIFTNITGENV